MLLVIDACVLVESLVKQAIAVRAHAVAAVRVLTGLLLCVVGVVRLAH